MKMKKKGCTWASADRNRCRRKQPGTGNPGRTVTERCSSEASTISPSESPTVPHEECENDADFLFNNKEGKDCARAYDGRNRCRREQTGTGNPGSIVLKVAKKNVSRTLLRNHQLNHVVNAKMM